MSLLLEARSADPKRKSVCGRVSRAWEKKTVVCIAGGPSLDEAQLSAIREAREADRVRVIVVNDAYLVAPWADVLYFADSPWAQKHRAGLQRSWPWTSFTEEQVRDAFASFAGQKVTIKHADTFDGAGVFVLDNLGPDGISEKDHGICTGSNSGYQALNIAVLSGGTPILLVAYDMRYHGKRTHSHNGHAVKMPESTYFGYARHFSTMQVQLAKLRVKVVNCTPNSAIPTFDRGDLVECLARIA